MGGSRWEGQGGTGLHEECRPHRDGATTQASPYRAALFASANIHPSWGKNVSTRSLIAENSADPGVALQSSPGPGGGSD